MMCNFHMKIPEEANARYVASFKEDIPLYLDGTEATMVIEFCRRYNCNVEASFGKYTNHIQLDQQII